MYKHSAGPDFQSGTRGKSLIWYEAPASESCVLQINSIGGWWAAVFAIRFRICSGWHRFQLGSTLGQSRNEARRLAGWLGRDWFESPAKRREYRRLHHGCSGFTWKLIRQGLEVPRYEDKDN